MELRVARRWGHGRVAVRERDLGVGMRQVLRHDSAHRIAGALELLFRNGPDAAVCDHAARHDIGLAEGFATRSLEVVLLLD
jgi:hypothetical protein